MTGSGCNKENEIMVSYADPFIHAPASFNHRINEIVLLELRTVRLEKSAKKLKKRRSNDDNSL